jgi:hypothetical protein
MTLYYSLVSLLQLLTTCTTSRATPTPSAIFSCPHTTNTAFRQHESHLRSGWHTTGLVTTVGQWLTNDLQVFALLVFEMALFVTLIVPLPFKIKRGLFTFISENPLVAKLQYGMKITFIFILILFVDSVNRVYRVQLELSQAKSVGGAAA